MIWIKIALVVASSLVGWLHAALQYKWSDGRTRVHKRLRWFVFPLLWLVLSLSLCVVWKDDKASSSREESAKHRFAELKKQHDELLQQRSQERKEVLKAVAPKVRRLLYLSDEQFSAMAIASKHLELGSITAPSEEQVRMVFADLNPRGESIMGVLPERRMLNWLEFMDNYNQKTIETISEIYVFMPFLDAEFATRLATLRECYHFKGIQLYASGGAPANTNLNYAAGMYTEYQNKLRPIRDYYVASLKAHDNGTATRAVIPMIPWQRKEKSNN